jgi:hypothetical protein
MSKPIVRDRARASYPLPRSTSKLFYALKNGWDLTSGQEEWMLEELKRFNPTEEEMQRAQSSESIARSEMNLAQWKIKWMEWCEERISAHEAKELEAIHKEQLEDRKRQASQSPPIVQSALFNPSRNTALDKSVAKENISEFISCRKRGRIPSDSVMDYVAGCLVNMADDELYKGNAKNAGRDVDAGQGVPLDIVSIQCLVMKKHLALKKEVIATKISIRSTFAEERRRTGAKEKLPLEYWSIKPAIEPMSEKTIQRLIARGKQLCDGTVPDWPKSAKNIAMSRDDYVAFEIAAVEALIGDSDWNFESDERDKLKEALNQFQAARDKRRLKEHGPEDKIWDGPLDHPMTWIELITPSE